MSRSCPRARRARTQILAAGLIAASGLAWDATRHPAAAQAYNGGPNQVIINMDVLNAMPGAYGQGAYGAPAYGQPYQPYARVPQSQVLPGAVPQYPSPLGAPRYLPPYQPYGAAQAGALPLAPGLAGLAVPPARTPSSVLTTLGPDGRPIQPVQLKQPGSTKTKTKKKKETYAAPAQAAAAPEPAPQPEAAPAPEPAPAADEQLAAVSPPSPPEEPAAVPETVPMPEATPPAPETGATVETAPEAPAEDALADQQAAITPEAPAETPAPEASAEEAPAEEAPVEEAPAAEAPAEEAPAEETASAEAPAEPDNSAPAAPIPQGGIRIVFPAEVNEVPTEANAALDDLAGQMLADESMRIQILCYAGGSTETESKARRKSLARCINIRQYLFKKDVRTTRMDVRALGLKSEGQPADRVDIVPAGS